jgi:hypothetical protein
VLLSNAPHQIRLYLERRFSTHASGAGHDAVAPGEDGDDLVAVWAGGSPTAGPRTGSSDGTLAPHEYLSVMESSPSVMEMTRNPFVLRLFVDALPAILASRTGRSSAAITRYDIYSSFVKQWFGQ